MIISVNFQKSDNGFIGYISNGVNKFRVRASQLGMKIVEENLEEIFNKAMVVKNRRMDDGSPLGGYACCVNDNGRYEQQSGSIRLNNLLVVCEQDRDTGMVEIYTRI